MMATKRPSYDRHVEWIALNDEPTILDIEEAAQMLTITMTADLFDKSPEQVATDVVRFRDKHMEV